jgi:rsbT co-antagonist protein RsbR
MPAAGQTLRRILAQSQKELLADWFQAQLSSTLLRGDLMKESELREQSREFLSLLQGAVGAGNLTQADGAHWAEAREFLARVSG